MKAIETRYKGYRFRSRLEARWAVFFDVLGIAYLYESEGFARGDIRYLPDFHLPEMDLWFEVKGVFPTEEEQMKAVALTLSDNKKILAMTYGDPGSNQGLCWWMGKCLGDFLFISCTTCRQVGFVAVTQREPSSENYYFYRMRCEHKGIRVPVEGWFAVQQSAEIMDAYTTARSARFEYGETPKVPRGKKRR